MTQSSASSRRAPVFHLGHPDGHIPKFAPPGFPSKPASRKAIAILFLCGLLAAFLAHYLQTTSNSDGIPDVHPLWILPFGMLLVSIAVMPFIARHFWEKNYHWVSLALAAVVAAYYFISVPQGFGALSRSMGDYISFICITGALFIVSGGILIRVRRRATPAVNVSLLFAGALLANILGTTGASMLLIRPFLRINQGHSKPFHLVFFIFIVSNFGGALTPIGPPLFLGYLKGVPFWWVLQNCWPMWCLATGCLLALFFLLDSLAHRRQPRAPHDPHDIGPAISLFGAGNLLYIALIIAAVFLASPWREALMVLAACASLLTTHDRIHLENVFNFAPIREVALLFLGIFATMVPALNYLGRHAQDDAFKSLLNTPGQFYFYTGTLSCVLDNAPTYVTFYEAQTARIDPEMVKIAAAVMHDKTRDFPDSADYLRLWESKKNIYLREPWRYYQDAGKLYDAIATLHYYHHDRALARELTDDQIRAGFLVADPGINLYLVAISLGSVFFGALTYIGNGPNFMVKSIAQNAGVQCPSFFGYIFLYTIPLVVPVILLVWALFLV